MTRRPFIVAALCTAVCFLTGVSGSAPAQPRSAPEPHAPRQAPPGEGVICAWAIYTTMASVGAKCFPGKNPGLQAELDDAVARMDAYVLRNARSASPAMITDFKRRQGHVGTPAAELCKGDAVMMYEMLEKSDWTNIRQEIGKGLARDGEPTWGTCF